MKFRQLIQKTQQENKVVVEFNSTRAQNFESLLFMVAEYFTDEIRYKRLCNCKKEIKNEGNLCDSCLQQKKCSRCQNIVGKHYQLRQNRIYCQDCFQCSQCNKQTSRQEIILMGSYLTHKSCSQIKKKESKLKVCLLETIRKQLKTKEHELKHGKNYFTCLKFDCVEQNNNQNYIVGYHHFFEKDYKHCNPEKHKVSRSQAEQFLIEDFRNAENLVAKLLIENGKKISDINENVLMLFISAAFIFREKYLIKTFLTSAANNNYNHLYYDLLEFRCRQQKKHTCTIKNKIQNILDFFNERFHRKDGRKREKQQLSDLALKKKKNLHSKRS